MAVGLGVGVILGVAVGVIVIVGEMVLHGIFDVDFGLLDTVLSVHPAKMYKLHKKDKNRDRRFKRHPPTCCFDNKNRGNIF